MFGGEAEHDGPLKTEVKTTFTNAHGVVDFQEKAKYEPRESVNPSWSNAREGVSRFFAMPIASSYYYVASYNACSQPRVKMFVTGVLGPPQRTLKTGILMHDSHNILAFLSRTMEDLWPCK